MEDILETGSLIGMIYKYGSGSGINYSALRGKGEKLSKGGVSSGVLPFMKAHDAIGGSIRSGGKTRRAAHLAVLNVDHPDIMDFIDCKSIEEKKVKMLIEGGLSADFADENGAYASVAYQNANHSVRVTDSFMKAVKNDETWKLVSPHTAKAVGSLKARKICDKIAEAAWTSGDPGLQFDDVTNQWNSLANEGRINGSNPCNEYCSVDNTACNLGSINLLKFWSNDPAQDRNLNWELLNQVSQFAAVCLDAIIGNASFPSEQITKNVLAYRQIGLGFANFGALAMRSGLPYDSEEACELAAHIANCMTHAAYTASVSMAKQVGVFTAYGANKDSVLRVLGLHNQAATEWGTESWSPLLSKVEEYGLRNSFVSVLAPTGTIGLQMDCDTFGIEPDTSLIKYKRLVGGGTAKIVNNSVPFALKNLGYNDSQINEMLSEIREKGHLEDSVCIKKKDLPVFDTALTSGNGKRSIRWQAHINILAAVQPFLSGSVSKTINMPNSATVDDIKNAYMMAWEKGLKCVALYRDGCKQSQPLNTTKDSGNKEEKIQRADRVKLPDDRQALTHKFSVQGHEGYITVGLYPDGRPGEVFINVSKEGSTTSGLLDAFATMTSIALQYGAPLESIVDKLKGASYEPQGMTSNPKIRFAKSFSDYLARFLENNYLKKELTSANEPVKMKADAKPTGNLCPSCDGMLQQSGTCEVCTSCGQTSGCS